MSPGEQVVDLTHVDDVVGAFLVAAHRLLQNEEASLESFLVSGERFSVRELTHVVGEALGKPVPAILGERPYRAREVMLPVEPSAAQLLPDWAPRQAFREAIISFAEGEGPKRG
jgi:nucleoside-diphosphate-sugar epimerase